MVYVDNPGIYFYSLKAGNITETGKFTVFV